MKCHPIRFTATPPSDTVCKLMLNDHLDGGTWRLMCDEYLRTYVIFLTGCVNGRILVYSFDFLSNVHVIKLEIICIN